MKNISNKIIDIIYGYKLIEEFKNLLSNSNQIDSFSNYYLKTISLCEKVGVDYNFYNQMPK